MGVPRGMHVAGGRAATVLGVEQVLMRMALTGEQSVAACKDIVSEGGALVAEDAKHRAPRLTGNMANSIKVQRVAKKGPAGARAYVTWDKQFFYGMFQERGTSKMEANPFLGPAQVAQAPAYERLAAVKWVAALGKAAGR